MGNGLAALLRRLRERLALMASDPRAAWLLFVCAFLEAALLPVPPDLLFVPMSLARPRRAFPLAGICVAGSSAGALAGYCIGRTLFEGVGEHVIALLGASAALDRVLALYRQHAALTLLLAGFTSIPFSVFTIAAGFRSTVAPALFVPAAAAGRFVRFFLLGALLRSGSPFLRILLARHLAVCTLLLLILVVLCIIIARSVA